MPVTKALAIPPDAVRDWLHEQWLLDPSPPTVHDVNAIGTNGPIPDISEPVAMVPLQLFTTFLREQKIGLHSCLEASIAAGWILDLMIEYRMTIDPAKSTYPYLLQLVSRYNLPVGRTRLLGIRKAVCHQPAHSHIEMPAEAPGAAPQIEPLGTFASGCFRWAAGPRGLVTQIPGKQWKLLNALLKTGANGATISELVKAVRCKKGSDIRRAIRNLTNALSITLQKGGAPFRAELTTTGADTVILIDTLSEQKRAA